MTDHKILSLHDYLELSQERKEYAQYSVMAEQNNWRNEFVREFREYRNDCEKHFDKLYRRKFMDKTTALGAGFVGGFIAMAGFLLLKWESLKDLIR